MRSEANVQIRCAVLAAAVAAALIAGGCGLKPRGGSADLGFSPDGYVVAVRSSEPGLAYAIRSRLLLSGYRVGRSDYDWQIKTRGESINVDEFSAEIPGASIFRTRTYQLKYLIQDGSTQALTSSGNFASAERFTHLAIDDLASDTKDAESLERFRWQAARQIVEQLTGVIGQKASQAH